MDEEWTFLADEKVEVAGVNPKEEFIPLVLSRGAKKKIEPYNSQTSEDLAPPLMGASVYFSTLEENLFLLSVRKPSVLFLLNRANNSMLAVQSARALSSSPQSSPELYT